MRTVLKAVGAGIAMLFAQQLLAQSVPPDAPVFTLFLKTGTFYGPSNKGVHTIGNAEVRGIVLTGPLQGVIPFFNNGAAAPNVIAEVLQGGPIDGFTSDGRVINENIDTGLRLVLTDPDTGESADIMVVSVEAETITPDAKGNLVFEAHVVADPGEGALVTPFTVHFTSGAAKVPLSRSTAAGLPGGLDFAGPFASGHVLIGRIGDFDHDGLLDGELVQAENAPMELVVARGDPIAQRRPWASNIPSTPVLSALLNLNGIVQNFPEPLIEALQQGRVRTAIDYGFDITERLNAALYDINAILASSSCKGKQRARLRSARSLIRFGRSSIERGLDQLINRKIPPTVGAASMQRGLQKLGLALLLVAQEQPAQAPSMNLSAVAAGLGAELGQAQ